MVLSGVTMESTFKHIKTHKEQREYYPLLVEACEYISRAGADNFAPDVYSAIQSGRAELVIGYHAGKAEGLFTCYPVSENGSIKLHIWHGYIKPGGPKQYLIDAFEYLETYAKDRGCAELVFGTTRKGWLKVIPKFGFELQQYTFSKKL